MRASLLILILILLLLRSSPLIAACKVATPEGLSKYIKEHRISRVVFFASWCSDCKHSLARVSKTDVVVGVYDTQERLSRIFKSLNKPEVHCFVDQNDQIAEAYKVKGLPYEFAATQPHR